MDNVTITLYVEYNSLPAFTQTIKVLAERGGAVAEQYKFNPSDIIFSHATISNRPHINIPIELYASFMYCYKLNGGKL